MLVILSVWVSVAMGIGLLWLARPQSIEGATAMLAMLLYMPLLVIMVVAGIATLLHGLVRHGWALFAGLPAWILLGGVVALCGLYQPVLAIRGLRMF